MHCPILGYKIAEGDQCNVSSCMYHQSGKCEYVTMATDKDREGCLRELGLLEEAQNSAERIRQYLIVDAYITYRIGKTYLDKLSEGEYTDLLDEDRYDEWPKSKALGYEEMKQVLLNHMKGKHHHG